MRDELAFIGDVHGNLTALRSMRDLLVVRGGPHVVFLGDYVNKGSESAAVLAELLALRRTGSVTLLRGNHETALLEALESGDLTTFIKMGGAVTIRSYVGGPVEPDVSAQFRSVFPAEHLEMLRDMPELWRSKGVVAHHIPASGPDAGFSVTAHQPIGPVPLITKTSAQLDTGCGTASGRLTALLWPSLDYLQVDAQGDVVVGPRDGTGHSRI